MENQVSLLAGFLAILANLGWAKYDIIDITIPHPVWDGVKSVICTAYPVKANSYIKSFYPLHRKNTVRHISTVLCDVPHSTEKYWECATPELTCGPGKSNALWAMAKDGPAWYLPKDLAVTTGTADGYIIVQVHAPAGMTLKSTPESFATGLRLNITDEKPKYYSASAAYGNIGYIPALAKDFTADAACDWPYDNNPVFAVSLHSHTMATAISGYIYRNGKYIELLRADPVYPEPIIDISSRKLVLKKGDTVLMRCTLTNPMNKTAYFGFHHEDQMCDFYIFYGIPNASSNLYSQVVCGLDAQTYHWNRTDVPSDSTLPDKEGYAKLIKPFHLKKREY